MLLPDWTVAVCRVATGVTLLLAALSKLRRPMAFVAVVRDFSLVPDSWAPGIAAGLAGVELVCGAVVTASLAYRELRAAAFLAMVLFLVFAGAMAINLVRGRTDVSCGCFGDQATRISWAAVGRSLLLCVVARVASLEQTALFTWNGPAIRELGAGLVLAVLLLGVMRLSAIVMLLWTSKSAA